MQRQAKLLKRVSNLEDKLERAKRELRDLAGEEDPLPRGSLNEERPYQRKFVPGALPSLPSERLLHEAESTTMVPDANTLQVPETEDQAQIRIDKTRLKSPKSWRKPSETRSSSAHSPSRKRKSPDPESRKKQDQSDSHGQPLPIPPVYSEQSQERRETQIPGQAETETNPALAESDINQKTPSRKPKLPKNTRSDSPGSVERKQDQRRSPAAENNTGTSPSADRMSPSAPASRPPRSTTRNRSATPVLRMKRGRGDLRSTTSPGHGRGRSPGPSFEDNKENQHYQHFEGGEDHPFDCSPKKLEQQPPQQHDIEPSQQDESTTPSSNSTSNRRKARYEYIPPVPPLPKDLAATAAKVDRRLAREIGKRREQMEKDGIATAPIRKSSGGFQWPEEFF
ncbi:hypothetical protein BDW74DRAFT_162037 [Aspergillus multicolor]|uniref:putative nuclear RNA binding protein n=1 Tax=Aspergillus multicolor TaxID=41759 RepID=UPI003CCD4279